MKRKPRNLFAFVFIFFLGVFLSAGCSDGISSLFYAIFNPQSMETTEIYEKIQIYSAFPEGKFELPWDEPRPVIPGSEITFEVFERSLLEVGGHIGFENHRARIECASGSCCVSMDVVIDIGEGFGRIIGSNKGENIPAQRHYWIAGLDAKCILEPGIYTIAVRARAYSSDKHADGLARTNEWNYSIVWAKITVLE